MIHLNYLAIAVAAVAVVVFAAIYYAVLGPQLAQLSDAAAAGSRPMALVLGFELFKSLVVAAVVAGLRGSRGSSIWAALVDLQPAPLDQMQRRAPRPDHPFGSLSTVSSPAGVDAAGARVPCSSVMSFRPPVLPVR